MKGDIALAGFVLTAEEWEALDPRVARAAASRRRSRATTRGSRAPALAESSRSRPGRRMARRYADPRRTKLLPCPETASRRGARVVLRSCVLTDDARYAALVARDARFDGVFFVGVQHDRHLLPADLPGAHARPRALRRSSRPPRSPRPPASARASAAGPSSRPATRPVDAVDALVAAAAAADRGGRAERAARSTSSRRELGVTARHLRRAIEARLGVSPVELAQSRRLALAKQLLQDTALPLTEIAFAAGFGSVRRFNAVFAARMGSVAVARSAARTPARPRRAASRCASTTAPPYDWARLLGFLRARAIPGVESRRRRRVPPRRAPRRARPARSRSRRPRRAALALDGVAVAAAGR